jgi:hypothetical protein
VLVTGEVRTRSKRSHAVDSQSHVAFVAYFLWVEPLRWATRLPARGVVEFEIKQRHHYNRSAKSKQGIAS